MASSLEDNFGGGAIVAQFGFGIFAEGERVPAAAGRFTHVYVDRETRRPTALPDRLRNVLEALVL